MAKIKIKCNLKNFEKDLNKSIGKIIQNKQKEIIEKNNLVGANKMILLSETEETMLLILLSKSNNGKIMQITGNCNEFPEYMDFNIEGIIEKLKLFGYISFGKLYIGGDWHIILTPDALSYFEKKGMRKELFEELTDQAKELLKEIIIKDEKKENIDTFLSDKIEEDELNRGIIGMLIKNGLINVTWASDTVYSAELTYPGKTYFEREKKYMEQIEKMNRPLVNITNTGFLNMGNITDSNVTINNSIDHLEKEIEEKGNEDKEELKQILEEVKDYIDNMNVTKSIAKNTGLCKRIGNHFNKHQWFYSQVIGLLGQALLLGMGNKS